MKINKIRFKNFASYGNKIHEIEFPKDEGNFYLVVGASGNGKSTVLHVISWLIYGKVLNKKVTDIPNRFNGDVWGQIDIQKDLHTRVIIERTQRSIEVKTLINDEEIEYDQAGKKNIQNYIEDEIIKMPFYVFNNIIGLSVNDFKSFLSMNPRDKRQIIDKICNLDIINRIKEFVRGELKDVREQMLLIDNQITILTQNIETSDAELQNLKNKLILNTKDKIESINENITKYKTYISDADERIKKLEVNREKVLSIKSDLISKINDITAFFREYYEKEKLYQNDKCPVCTSSLKTEEHQHIFSEWEEQYNGKKEHLEKFKESLEDVKIREKSINELDKKLSKQNHTAKIYLQNSLVELEKLNNRPNTEETKSLENIIKTTTTKIEKSKNTKKVVERKNSFYKILEDIFGDHGVKVLAIKRILPSLNIEINRVIKDLNLEYRVQFNQEFDATIWHLGHEVTPQMLSTGERKKIDFAVLIAIIKLLKNRYHGLNLFFLDEIFSSIDSNSIYHVIRILNQLCKDMMLNIFVINHAPLPLENFNFIMQIEKNNGFSNINIERLS